MHWTNFLAINPLDCNIFGVRVESLGGWWNCRKSIRIHPLGIMHIQRELYGNKQTDWHLRCWGLLLVGWKSPMCFGDMFSWLCSNGCQTLMYIVLTKKLQLSDSLVVLDTYCYSQVVERLGSSIWKDIVLVSPINLTTLSQHSQGTFS